jgi:uncharacterized protein (UPF0335 family)
MDTGEIDGERLKSFVERYERLQEEIDALNEARSELMKELAAVGFDKTIFKIVIKRRKTSQYELEFVDTLVDLYERALALESPASRAPARERRADEAADLLRQLQT